MSYRNQFIWQRAVQLAINCYKFTRLFPQSELYGLTSQIRRSSVSVASNIADRGNAPYLLIKSKKNFKMT
jgi:four helix bundle protein